MALGLGTRLGEYKDPETQSHHLRRSLYSARKWSGYGLDFTGDNDYTYRSNLISEGNNAEVTLTLRVKADDVTERRCLFSTVIGSLAYPGQLYTIYINDSKLACACAHKNQGAGNVYSGDIAGKTSSTISNGTWYHVVATFSVTPSAQSCELWINGVKQTGSADGEALWHTGQGAQLGFATYGQDSDSTDVNITDVYFDGVINQIAGWRGTLSDAQIAALYFNGKPRSPMNIGRGPNYNDEGVYNPAALVSCWPVIKQDIQNLYLSDDRAMQAYMRSNGSSNTKWESGDSDNEALIGTGFPVTGATVEEYFNE